jgi:DNA repair and recombination RAD54-like protein
MTITKRQKLVDQFNDPEGKEFVFLLSSKAGGCGINLIGANRLILFDPGKPFIFEAPVNSHISPQTGILQQTSRLWHVSGAMAKRKNVWHHRLLPCACAHGCLLHYFRIGFVYRFISTGTIEEKIFQRQASKQALSSAVVDEKEDAERHFSTDALRKLFLFNEHTDCETHETFKCKRCKTASKLSKLLFCFTVTPARAFPRCSDMPKN